MSLVRKQVLHQLPLNAETGDNAMKFLTGKDYPWLCAQCQARIDEAVPIVMLLIQEGPDRDWDEEAPCEHVYDQGLFCGGHECVNKPEGYS